MLKFYKLKSDKEIVNYLYNNISQLLRNGKVLWLIPGGSAAKIAVNIADRLRESSNLNNLTVSLTDERFGPINHSDSNWKLLMDLGFKLPNARMLPVLDGGSLEQTAEHYSLFLNQALANCDYSLALAGIGADGHIFGILPHSPAINFNKDICAYQGDDFSRITLTEQFIKRLDEVVIYTVGTQKQLTLDKIDTDISVDKQPAQLLKNVKKAIIFNDYKGESL